MRVTLKVLFPSAMLPLLAACAVVDEMRSAEEVENPKAAHVLMLKKFAGWFDGGSVIGVPQLVRCKLSGGTETVCYSITLKTEPSGFKPGPWCPTNISDGPEKAGIWLDKGKVFDADGKFIENLATFYDDKFWQLFNAETGKVNVTDTKEKCDAAARPDVDPDYRNYCVECQISYMAEGASMTYTMPIEPVRASRPGERVGFAGVGLAFNGVRLDGPAPVDAILDAHTLAPFDDCGGHTNLHVGAFALTAHPDFDDTPLFDENGDGNLKNHGNEWHSHWVVLQAEAACGKDAL